MVQTINRKTYRCRICKKIYMKLKEASECEDSCVQESNYTFMPRVVIAKIEGKKHHMVIYDKVLKDDFQDLFREKLTDRYFVKPNIFIRPILKALGKPTTKEEMIQHLKKDETRKNNKFN